MIPSDSTPTPSPEGAPQSAETASTTDQTVVPDATPEGGGERPVPKRVRWGRVLWVGLVAILVVASWGVRDFNRFLQTPLSAQVVLEIEKGWSLNHIADTLEAEGVVTSAPWFILLTRFTQLRIATTGITQGPGIQAGEYAFPIGETPDLALTRLTTGNQVVHRLVIPEGMTVAEIGAKMQSLEWKDAEAFLMDPETPKKLGLDVLEGQTLEGWLFPSTYYYHRRDSAQEVLARMVVQSRQVLQELWREADQETKSKASRAVSLSPIEALVLASIIEKETGRDEERPRISAVFHNRLRKKMRLQSDPTVIYGLKQAEGAEFDGNLTRKHLKIPTPYNTYTQPGLPPTPICNPGKASIRAALHPEEGDDLYFVARGEGFHVFSKTLKEHEANVDTYQRHPSPKKRQ